MQFCRDRVSARAVPATILHPTFRLERPGHDTQRGTLRRVPLTKRLAEALRKYRHLRSPRVLCQDNGEPFTRQMVQTRVKRAARRAEPVARRRTHPASHVLLASRDAWSARESDSGTCRPQGADDDAAVHAPESGSARHGDSVVGGTGRTGGSETSRVRLKAGAPAKPVSTNEVVEHLETGTKEGKRSIKPGTKLAVRQGFEFSETRF